MRSSDQHKKLGFLSRNAKPKGQHAEAKLDPNVEKLVNHLLKREYEEAKAMQLTQDLLLATAPMINDNGKVFKDIPLFKFALWIGDMTGIDLFINGCAHGDPAESLLALQKLKDIFKHYKKSGVTFEEKGEILKGQKCPAHEVSKNSAADKKAKKIAEDEVRQTLKVIEDNLNAGIEMASSRQIQANLMRYSLK